MCRKAKQYGFGWLKRLIIWLAWHFLKPKCKDCEEAEKCGYNAVMAKRSEGEGEGSGEQ